MNDQINNNMVYMKNISKFFGHVVALNKVNFKVSKNEILALVGDNGAGKSTLIKILSGMLIADEGEIYFDGRKVEIDNPRDAQSLGIGTVYQNLNLVDCMSAAENLFLGMELTKFGFVDKKKMSSKSQEIIRRMKVDLTSSDLTVGYLSGGQRQSLAIGRVMLRNSNLIILDEPTAALGVNEVNQVFNFVKNLKKMGKTIVVISHNIEHVFYLADRIFVLRQGKEVGSRIIDETTKEEIVGMITGAILK